MTDLATLALQLARGGAFQALDHANEVEPNWSAQASEILRDFALTHAEFMAEDVRVHAHSIRGLPEPPDPRAWGAVINAAARNGIIVRDRYELTKIPPAHATPRPVWRSRVYGS